MTLLAGVDGLGANAELKRASVQGFDHASAARVVAGALSKACR